MNLRIKLFYKKAFFFYLIGLSVLLPSVKAVSSFEQTDPTQRPGDTYLTNALFSSDQTHPVILVQQKASSVKIQQSPSIKQLTAQFDRELQQLNTKLKKASPIKENFKEDYLVQIPSGLTWSEKWNEYQTYYRKLSAQEKKKLFAARALTAFTTIASRSPIQSDYWALANTGDALRTAIKGSKKPMSVAILPPELLAEKDITVIDTDHSEVDHSKTKIHITVWYRNDSGVMEFIQKESYTPPGKTKPMEFVVQYRIGPKGFHLFDILKPSF